MVFLKSVVMAQPPGFTFKNPLMNSTSVNAPFWQPLSTVRDVSIPFQFPKRAKKRRHRVLTKMLGQKKILPEELQEAIEFPLPKKLDTSLLPSAPYYVDAVNGKLKELGIKNRSGLKVYTAMDPRSQFLAEKAVTQGLESLEKNHPLVKKLKEKNSLPLQTALLASNPQTGEVTAIVGGRNFSSSPFNRATKGRRQVGSIFKPIVYLTAMSSLNKSKQIYNPKTPVNNSPFTYKYKGQTWEPNNYDKSFSPPIPLFYALKESINVPTARLAIEVGLSSIITMARSVGVESKLKEYPSLSLGAFELSPLEALKVYNSFSQMGLKRDLQIVKSVRDQRDQVLYLHKDHPQKTHGNKEDFAILVGMMKEVLESGTARRARSMGFRHVAAGKTGSTPVDAWFAGFTPSHTAVVWVGYDDGSPHGLTGASGALPIWTQYMREMTKPHGNKDFDFPDSVEKRKLTAEELTLLGVPKEKAVDTELVFQIQEKSQE